MTKKHYIDLAKMIRKQDELWSLAHVVVLADWIAKTNPRFDAARWIDYVKTGIDHKGEN